MPLLDFMPHVRLSPGVPCTQHRSQGASSGSDPVQHGWQPALPKASCSVASQLPSVQFCWIRVRMNDAIGRAAQGKLWACVLQGRRWAVVTACLVCSCSLDDLLHHEGVTLVARGAGHCPWQVCAVLSCSFCVTVTQLSWHATKLSVVTLPVCERPILPIAPKSKLQCTAEP